MRYLSVCSGIEAATVAWHGLGWTPVAFSEIEKFPSQVLAHHYPDVPNLGDMTNYKEWDIDSIDVLVGGTPCQSFSVAGLRKGLEDPRGNLALVYCGILDRFRPKWCVWENVPGVLSSNGGRDFGSFLGALAELGYGFAYRVLDAQYFGVAQRRRRVFVVGHLGDWQPAAQVLFESESLRRDTAPSREAGKKITCTPDGISGAISSKWSKGAGGPAGDEHYNLIAGRSGNHSHWDGDYPHPTLNQSAKKSEGIGSSNQEIFSQRGAYLAPATQPMPTSETFPIPTLLSSTAGVSRTGNAATEHETYIPMAYNIAPGKGKLKDDIHVTDGAITKTLDASGSNPTMHQGGSAIVQPIPLNSMNCFRSPEADPSTGCGVGEQGEAMFTISKTNHHAVAQPIDTTQVTSPYNYSNPKSGDPCHPLAAGAHVPAIAQSMAVRRLTPVECERLQGFPDGYTDIRESCPDGPRYKALGNSMAVPVMKWIGGRINAK